MSTPSLKKMARSTTEGIYASSTLLLQDSSLSSQYPQDYHHSSSHQPARQDTGLTQNLPGSQLRPLAMDHPSTLPPRSNNTSSSADGLFNASAPAGWPSSFTSSFYNTPANTITARPVGCLDGSEDAHQQKFHKHATAFIENQRSETTRSRRTPPTITDNNNTTASPITRSPESPTACVRSPRKNQARWVPYDRTTEQHNTTSLPTQHETAESPTVTSSPQTRSGRQTSTGCVRSPSKNQSRWDPYDQATQKHNTTHSPPAQPENSESPTAITCSADMRYSRETSTACVDPLDSILYQHHNTTSPPSTQPENSTGVTCSADMRFSRQPSAACVRTPRKNESRWDPLGRTLYQHHNTSSPRTQPERSESSTIIKTEDECQTQLEAIISRQTPDRHMDAAEASFSYPPESHPDIVYISIEHDDYQYQSEADTFSQTPDRFPTSTPSVEYQDRSGSVTSYQTPEGYLPTAAKPISTAFEHTPVAQSPRLIPSNLTTEHQLQGHGSNKRPNDFVFSSLPADIIQRAAKRQRVGDNPEADEPQSLNSCSQSSPFPTIQHADKRSHVEAFGGADRSESVPCQAHKKRRTQEFKTFSSRSTPSGRSLPGRQPNRFSLRDFLRKRNRPDAAMLSRLQLDGAADQPSANNHGDQEREKSPDSLFDDDGCAPELDECSGDREMSPSSLFDEEECTGQDNAPDASVTLQDPLSAVGGECPTGQESNPPAKPPQTATAPVEVQGTNGNGEGAASGPVEYSAGFRAFLLHQPTNDKYVSPYGPCGETRAIVPPASLHRAGVEAATTREKSRLEVLEQRVTALNNERDAARRKLSYWTFVDPATGKSREQILKAESLRTTRALRAQERKTTKAQSEVEEWKTKYDKLVSAHNELLARHSALLNLTHSGAHPINQVWLGPSQHGSGPVGGPTLGSSQRRDAMPLPREGAAGRGAVAGSQRGRVDSSNVIDLTGENAGAANQPQSSNPRPAPSEAPSPAVTVTSVAANAVAAAAAPVPAPVIPAPGVPVAARVASAPTPMRPQGRNPTNANANASAAEQAPVPVPATSASVPPVNVAAHPATQPAAPANHQSSPSPEAQELHARFRNKDYSWLSKSGSGFNHMTNRFQKPAFGLNCAPPVPTPPIEVPASRFLRQDRQEMMDRERAREKEREMEDEKRKKQQQKKKRLAETRAAARAAAAARQKSQQEQSAAGRDTASASASSPPAATSSYSSSSVPLPPSSFVPHPSSTSAAYPVAEGAEQVGGAHDMGGFGDGDLGCDFDELVREMEEECARATEERERDGEVVQGSVDGGEGEEEEEERGPGYTDEQIARMMEGEFDDLLECLNGPG